MMKQYTWNANTNCFEEYVHKFEIKKDTNGIKHKIIIPPTCRLFNSTEVEGILNNIPAGCTLKDVDGVPAYVIKEGE
jgi:hypothetical protein